MVVLETIVSEDVKKLAKRGLDMKLIDACFRLAATEDKEHYNSIGASNFAMETVYEKVIIYRLSLEMVRAFVDRAARGLPPEEEPLAKAYEAAISSHNWLATLHKKGCLLRMPGYGDIDYLNMAAEYRHARLIGEVNSLLGRLNGSRGHM